MQESLVPAGAECLRSTAQPVGGGSSTCNSSEVAVELHLIIFNGLRCILTSASKQLCMQLFYSYCHVRVPSVDVHGYLPAIHGASRASS